MTDKPDQRTNLSTSVWIVSEFHYDWHQFEIFVGVAKTKQAALKLIKELYGDVDFPIASYEHEHKKLSSEERMHFYVFQDNIYEVVDK